VVLLVLFLRATEYPLQVKGAGGARFADTGLREKREHEP
jgi:hypothetical protein